MGLIKVFILKNKALFVLGILVIGSFYWFQLRPSLIKQDCQDYAREMGSLYFGNEFIQKEEPLIRSQLQEEYMKGSYDRCLHDKGL